MHSDQAEQKDELVEVETRLSILRQHSPIPRILILIIHFEQLFPLLQIIHFLLGDRWNNLLDIVV